MKTVWFLSLVLSMTFYSIRIEGNQKVHKLLDCCDESQSQPVNRTVVELGYLTAVKGDLHNRQGRAISGALSFAIEQINNCSCLLPEVELKFIYRDTRGEENVSTEAVVDLICNNIAAFIGPEGPNCHTEAMVAGSKNKAMISYRCTDAQISSKNKYPTFTRMEPPDTQVTNSVLSLLEFYKWRKFSIIYQEGAQWQTIAKHLKEQAKTKDFVVNHYREFEDQNRCCISNLKCCNSMWPHPILKETKDATRIYVFIGQREMLVRFMKQMKVEQLFAEGKYMVIYLFPDTAVYDELGFFLWNKEDSLSWTSSQNQHKTCEQMGQSSFDQWRSLIVVSGSPYRVDTSEFATMVRKYNQLPPFNFHSPEILKKLFSIQIHISIYAAHLYDSVMLYAHALNNVIEKEKLRLRSIGKTEDSLDISKLARDGKTITQAIIEMEGYQSISGNFIRIDENGDSEGNFTAFALKEHNYTFVSRINNQTKFTCGHYPIKVGEFHSKKNKENGTAINYSPKVNIDWPGHHKPVDEPHCGFDSGKCPRSKGRTEIAVGILSGLLLIAILLTMSVYRKWKIEQEIEGLLWKINPDCLQGYRLHTSASKQSLGSVLSGESRCYYGASNCQAARYKGYFVRIKEIHFEKKKDIPRDVMKEMKLMRELRHDNINSFIGACIEPHCVMLITDFCAKGALQDILENPDIKLDPMFIASLIHDLIKGVMFLHHSDIISHGNLRSSNCVVTSRWTLQVTDFGLQELRNSPDRIKDDLEFGIVGNDQEMFKLLWKAPELLRDERAPARGTQKGDVYSFGIILYEIYGRQGPYGDNWSNLTYQEILEQVKVPEGIELMRPDLDLLVERGEDEVDYVCPSYVIDVMKDCWSENPESRPDFTIIRNRLKPMKNGMKANIMDQMVEMLEKYSNNLEDLVTERTRQLFEEKQKTEDLLHRMLPPSVARKLTHGITVEPESFAGVTIYFSDIVGFTSMCSESTPLQVVNFLNELYSKFDQIIQSFDVYKVETIGDAYMVVSGLPERTDEHAGNIASMAIELLSAVNVFKISHRPNDALKLRIGMHTGPVVAGVVGMAMPRYCLFGDTVNTASRMESNGLPLKIHISPTCNDELTRLGGYITEERGLIEMKGKGKVKTYWLIGATETVSINKRGTESSGKLKTLFKIPRNMSNNPSTGGNPVTTPEVRRRSPRMSMVNTHTFDNSSRNSAIMMSNRNTNNTPDQSLRNSLAQLAFQQTQGTSTSPRTGTPPVEKENDVFRFDKFTARKLLGGVSNRSPIIGSGPRLAPPNNGTGSCSVSPLLGLKTFPNSGSASGIMQQANNSSNNRSNNNNGSTFDMRRPRSLSDDVTKSFEKMALLKNGSQQNRLDDDDDEFDDAFVDEKNNISTSIV